ncbi:MAG: hypothetical protein ACAI44_00425, partial [Candidatus Sericytochromatia bacterium]
MEVHAQGSSLAKPGSAGSPRPPLKAAANVPAVPAEGLKPQEVPLLMSQSVLTQGKSLSDLPIVSCDADFPPRAILPQEIEKVLDAYNQHVRSALSQAKQGSRLDQFETSLRLMANLQDPRLQQDKEAWDVLQMRRSQIESSYQRLIQEPEIRQAFDQASHQALQDIFGTELERRTHQQAAYLLSDGFQQELDALPEAEIQNRIQQELSALAVLSPGQAERVADELIQRTLAHQSLKALQTQDDSGYGIRAGLSQALGLYLKAQQTALGVSLQATNISRLVNLPDDQIKLLTDAIADLARDIHADNHQQLALDLISRVDELPPDLRQNASSLIKHMHAQNVLGTVLFAGSLAGLLRQDLPQDPKAWASLGAGALGTATMAHFALRFIGFNHAADIAAKLNVTASLRGVNIPVVGALVTGVNTTLDAIALVEEVRNQDPAGATSRAMGVASGLATLAAITVMKGKAVPITLIASTLTGLAAWGIDSLWGETELTGKIRRELRTLGISYEEAATLDKLKGDQPLTGLSQEDRIALINALMDQATSSSEETRIFETLMSTPTEEFIPLMQKLHDSRLVSELENDVQLNRVLQQVASQAQPATGNDKLLASLLQGLVSAHRFDSLDTFLRQASPALKQTLPATA